MCVCLTFDLTGRVDSEGGELEPRRMVVRFPDSHQLFVGNLPHDIDESELKDFFMSTSLARQLPSYCTFRRPGRGGGWRSVLVAQRVHSQPQGSGF